MTLEGTVDRLCFPRFDSPSVFGELLGVEAGSWSIRSTERTWATSPRLSATSVW
ncbi:hypothetical protein [Streptomyces sp. NPDC003393]